MSTLLISAVLLGAAPTEDELLRDRQEANWNWIEADAVRSVHLNLTREKVGFGQRRTVILQVVSSPRIPGGRSLTHAWTGTWSVVPGEKETEIRCLFTRRHETGISGKLVRSDFFQPIKVTFFANDYRIAKRFPEMRLRYEAPEDEQLYVWKPTERPLFFHSAR